MRCAREAIAAGGVGSVRLEDIAARARMSVGHVMYHFGTRDRLLLETLCWSEMDVHAQLTGDLARLRSPLRRVTHFVERYLPQQPRDPRWSLWFQLSAAGVDAGAFDAVEPGDLAEWYLPYLDGLALEIVTAGSQAVIDPVVARATRRLKMELVGETTSH
ncbi:MAG: TetR/AcrR family transcriptional regulator [Myxococcales bacterium]|nr:TetR/AcrR family transcriptional regulator [Myxococcales bacterium]MDH5567184.1 TetR/AcrR family transcriptional regulator [Myxococcales bacterium]